MQKYQQGPVLTNIKKQELVLQKYCSYLFFFFLKKGSHSGICAQFQNFNLYLQSHFTSLFWAVKSCDVLDKNKKISDTCK